MPRIPRITISDIVLHVVQRGNNRHAVLFRDTDCIAYLNLLFESAERNDALVYAFVYMTNNVRILLSPLEEDSASRMMQRLGASRTTAINSNYRRAGSLWEGRFKSSLVDSERYVLACYRYIALKPVRLTVVSANPGAKGWEPFPGGPLSHYNDHLSIKSQT